MPILASSKAAAVGAGVNNRPAAATAAVMARNLVVIGTALAAKTGTYVPNLARLSGGPAESGILYGFGSMVHRMVKAAWAGHGGAIPTWVIPQDEAGGAVAATSNAFAITGTATAAGVFAAYIAGIRYAIAVAVGDTATVVGAALVAAMTADPDCPVTGINSTGTVACTAKSKGTWGNSIVPAVNIIPGDALPAGIACAVTALSTGAGVPTLATALNSLGTGSNMNTLPNGQGMTDLVFGYLQDQTSLTAIGAYGGLAPNDPPDGCYDHLVAKPFRCLVGDVTAGAAIPAALTSLATTNTLDRTTGLIAVPGSNTHPTEIAAQAMAKMALTNAIRAEQMYVGQVLAGVDPGYAANTAGTRWTNLYAQRDLAVKAGISPTLVVGGYVTMQNVMTFYAGNAASTGGYAEMVSISKIQNMLNSEMLNFKSSKWQGYSIVADTNLVTDPDSKAKARDIESVKDDCVALIKSFAAHAWIYETELAIKSIVVTIRGDGTGFTPTFAVVLSGIGNIIDVTMSFDTAIPAAA